MDQLSKSLADIILKNLQEEFKWAHLSRNLVNTIQVIPTEDGCDIKIPAAMYDIELFREKGVIQYTGKGSYASQIDKDGGFSGVHKNYINRCIKKSISEWKAINQIKARIS